MPADRTRATVPVGDLVRPGAPAPTQIAGRRNHRSRPTDEGEAFRTLRELLARPELLRPPPIVLPRLAWRGRVTLLAAPDKAGKSTLLAHAVAALTRGGAWLDGVLSPARALWCGLEEAPGDAVRRFSELGADPDRVQLYYSSPLHLWDAVESKLESWRPELIVVDSLAEYARITGDNGRAPDDGDSAGWGAVLRPLVELVRRTDCALVLLHHVRRSDGQYRSSGEIAAAVDVLLEMTKGRPGEDPTLRRLSGRGRWPIEELALRMVDGRYVLGGGGPLSLDARVLLDVAQNPGTSRTELAGRLSGRRQTILAEVSRLLRDGALSDEGGHLFTRREAPAELLLNGEEPDF